MAGVNVVCFFAYEIRIQFLKSSISEMKDHLPRTGNPYIFNFEKDTVQQLIHNEVQEWTTQVFALNSFLASRHHHN